ncbi:hypothetical protein GGTG_07576 [Gaeumannomyces tritici R3-111a-1]|uniref:Uncharacterized protein n=1 Tax=Gaeumannomyces tritici (strain R3-111a-1) TaxID=644352 RepID=J3P228_GAET3|nr:hypothetical protein GGTG_07576 [Gaeumannomyces tritici R3-111a-1]EJT73720.1 hypothetical protein GGTG_07576 [Gaeumannomyces tritici R3-111a-1]
MKREEMGPRRLQIRTLVGPSHWLAGAGGVPSALVLNTLAIPGSGHLADTISESVGPITRRQVGHGRASAGGRVAPALCIVCSWEGAGQLLVLWPPGGVMKFAATAPASHSSKQAAAFLARQAKARPADEQGKKRPASPPSSTATSSRSSRLLRPLSTPRRWSAGATHRNDDIYRL